MSVWAWLMLLTLRKWVRVPVLSDVSGMGFHVVLRRTYCRKDPGLLLGVGPHFAFES